MATTRTIFHVDMDAFFASIEQLDQPELRGKPVLVGHDGSRGVVAAASYEARRFECHSALPMAIAKRRCPQAIIVPVRGKRYREVSAAVFDIFDRYSPLVEPLSIDEAFLDLTGSERLLGPPADVAQRLKDEIKLTTGLNASIGVAPNKFLAKLASDLEKPDGLTIIPADRVTLILDPLPVTRIWGIGPAAANKLAQLSIHTIGDLRQFPTDRLRKHFGQDHADHMLRLARGEDSRDVVPDRATKSIGQEQTFGADLVEADAIRSVLLGQVEQVARRLRKHDLYARTVTLKIRFGDFETISRSQTLDNATQETAALWQAARAIFDRWQKQSFRPVRLIGMTASGLSATAGQLPLYDEADHEKQRKLDAAADAIANRFGKAAIRRAGGVPRSRDSNGPDVKRLGSSLRRDDAEQ